MKYLLLLIPFVLSFSCSPAPGAGINKAVIVDSLKKFLHRPFESKNKHFSIDTISVTSAEKASARAVIDLEIEYARRDFEGFRHFFQKDISQQDSLRKTFMGLPAGITRSQREQINSDLEKSSRECYSDSMDIVRVSRNINSLTGARLSSDSTKREFIVARAYYIFSYDDVVTPSVRVKDTGTLLCSFNSYYKQLSLIDIKFSFEDR